MVGRAKYICATFKGWTIFDGSFGEMNQRCARTGVQSNIKSDGIFNIKPNLKQHTQSIAHNMIAAVQLRVLLMRLL